MIAALHEVREYTAGRGDNPEESAAAIEAQNEASLAEFESLMRGVK